MLGSLLDVFRLRQYFNALTAVRDLAEGLREDASFFNTVRRSLVTLPGESHGASGQDPFPPFQVNPVSALRDRRVGIVASGGSGALASLVGVFRALEESGVEPAAMSVCSGSSLFGFPLAAGLPVDTVARFVLGLRSEHYVDINWSDIGVALSTGGRRFAGFVKGEKLERTYRTLLGDMRLGDLRIPCYAPLWNIEENRLEYAGPKTHPDLPVARAVRAAIAIPLFIDPVSIGRSHWSDGGIVDVFPVVPVLEIEPRCDLIVGVNGFYPPEFAGESAEGWREASMAMFRIASQVRTSQQIELARQNLARLRRAGEVLMTNPVPYTVVRGLGFYEQFLDNRDWPEFMRLGRTATLAALNSWRPTPRSAAAARTPRGRRAVRRGGARLRKEAAPRG